MESSGRPIDAASDLPGEAGKDTRFEGIIARLLLAGVSISAVVVLSGGICYLSHHRAEKADFHAFHIEPAMYRSISGILQGLGSGECRSIIQLGLLLLILTPVARVAVSLIAFLRERDRVYVGVTAIVLLVLVFSLVS